MAHGTTKGVPIDIDDTLSANSDLLVPSQKAIKTYVDNINLSDLNDVSILATPSTGQVLTFNASTSVWEAQPSAGGAGSIAYYLSSSNTQSPYKEFSSIPVSGADVPIPATISASSTTTVESFQTQSGVPGVTNIPAGRWAFYLHFSGTLSDSWTIFVEVYTRTSGGTETLRLTTDSVTTNSLNGTPTMILTDGVFPATSVLTTDRIVVKVRVTNNSLTSKTITFHTEGTSYYSIATTTLNPSFAAGAVSAVYGTAPITSSGGTTPTISISQATISTNGYLSSTDWTTFNSKVSSSRSISTTSPLSGGGDLSADRTLSISDAAADGSTKGAATFSANDFNSSSGLISIDYTNGQSASGSDKGFLTSTDWTTFNGKVSTTRSISTSSPLSGGGDLSADRTISIVDAAADGSTKGAATFSANDFNSSAGVISLDYINSQTATSLVNGFLSSTDWATFNGKVSTTRSISTSSPLSGGGDLSADRTISIADAAADGTTKGAATFNASDFNSATGLISIDYTNGQVSTNLVNGFLSSTDWSTFNGKQNAITLTTTGSNGEATLIGNTLNIPTYESSLIPKMSGNEIWRGSTFRNNSTTIDTTSGLTLTTSGTNTARSVATTSYSTRVIRMGVTASLTQTGRYSGMRGGALLWYVTGGFLYTGEFNISDTATAVGTHNFWGLASSTSDLTIGGVANDQPSALTNIIAFANDSGDSNLQIMHNDSSGTATKTDLGASFPSNRTVGAAITTIYTCFLYNAPNSSNVIYRIVNKETGAVAQGTISSNLPASTVGLNFFGVRTMGTSGGGINNTGQFDVYRLGVYSL